MSFQIPGAIKEKLFITISLFPFEISNPKPLKEQTPVIPSQALFFLGSKAFPLLLRNVHILSLTLPLWRCVIIRRSQHALLQKVLLILFLQTCRNRVLLVVLVSICAGPHPMQPERASKDSLGNLVLDIGNAMCGLIQSSRCSSAPAG